MGSVVSGLLGGGAADASDSTLEGSGVNVFHSSERWLLHFNASKESNQLMVIDFAATWCGPCKFMEPAVKSMASKYTDVDFVKIDVDELPDVAQEFTVQAMPTFVLLKKGKELERVIGAKKDELEKKIQKHRAVSNGSTSSFEKRVWT